MIPVMNYAPHIAARVLNTPMMILPEKLAVVASVLESRIGIDAESLQQLAALAPKVPEGSRYVGEFEIDPNDPRGGRKPYRTTPNGVAVVPIIGSLVNRSSFFDTISGIASYERIKFLVASATADPAVRAIVLDIDSPGGEAIGAFETADAVREAARVKTVVAAAGGLCCSAAYAIASAATRIFASPSSLVGSVGVVLLHVDHSRRIDKAGMTPTLIHAGARKVDGHPYAPLDEEVQAELQGEVERFMDLFIATVARGRPGMTEAAIRATEARTYLATDAVKVGLADEVGVIEGVVAAFAKLYPARSRLTDTRPAQSARPSIRSCSRRGPIRRNRCRARAHRGDPAKRHCERKAGRGAEARADSRCDTNARRCAAGGHPSGSSSRTVSVSGSEVERRPRRLGFGCR